MRWFVSLLLLAASASAQTAQGNFTQFGKAQTISVTSLAVTPSTRSVNLGSTGSYTATATYSNATTQNVTALASWSSLNTSYATLSAQGLFTCIAGGTATIQATYKASTATATIVCASLPVGITTTGLPSGNVSNAYNFCLSASGGTTPYTWAETGTLPSGMSFSTSTGCFSGTPTATDTVSLTFTVTDSASHTSPSVSLTLVINAATADDSRYCSNGSVNTNGTWNNTAFNQLSASGSTTGFDGPAQAPVNCVYTPMSAMTQNPDASWLALYSATVTVCPSGCTFSTLQAAFNAASPNDPSGTGYSIGCGATIQVKAQASGGSQQLYFEGDGNYPMSWGQVTSPYSTAKPLPLRCPTTNWLIVESDQIGNSAFPAEGTRATPCAVGVTSLPDKPPYPCPSSPTIVMPQITQPTTVNNALVPGGTMQAGVSATCAVSGTDNVLQATQGIRFIGLEITSRFNAIQIVSANETFNATGIRTFYVHSGAGGTGYQVGDVVTVSGGNGNGLLEVTSVSSGAVTGLSLVGMGATYAAGSDIATSGGHGTGLAVDIGLVGNECGMANIIFDRVLVHSGELDTCTENSGSTAPTPCTGSHNYVSGWRSPAGTSYFQATRDMDWTGSYVAQINSWIDDDVSIGTGIGGGSEVYTLTDCTKTNCSLGYVGSDSNNLVISLGPVKLVNNYLAAASEPYFMEGNKGVVATDIEVRRNHTFHPESWKFDAPDAMCQASATSPITAWTINANPGTTTFTAANSLTAGQGIVLGSFTTSTFFNNYFTTVSSATSTTFTVPTKSTWASSGSSTENGTFRITYLDGTPSFATAAITNCPFYPGDFVVKNSGENKGCQRCLFEANVYDQNYNQDQPGDALLESLQDQSALYSNGTVTTDTTGDMTISGTLSATNGFTPQNDWFQGIVGSSANPPCYNVDYSNPVYGGALGTTPATPSRYFCPVSFLHTGAGGNFPGASWEVIAYSCGAVSPCPVTAACTVASTSFTCSYYPVVTVAGTPSYGQGWYITEISRTGTTVTASLLTTLTDKASPPFPYTPPSENGTVLTTGTTALIRNVNISGSPSDMDGYFPVTLYINNSSVCPTVTLNGVSENNCVQYTTTNSGSETGQCADSYTSIGYTYTVCGMFSQLPEINKTASYNTSKPGPDPTSRGWNIVFRYNHIEHVPSAAALGSAFNLTQWGLHDMAFHDNVADDIDGRAYGVYATPWASTPNLQESYGPDPSFPGSGLRSFNSFGPQTVGNIGTCTESSTTATCTTTDPTTSTNNLYAHGFSVGQSIAVQGVSVSGYNYPSGVFITAVPTTSSFSFTTTSGLGTGTGGSFGFPAGVSDWLVTHNTILPANSNLGTGTPYSRSFWTPPTGTFTNYDAGFTLEVDQPVAFYSNLTYTNNITNAGFQSTAQPWPGECGTNRNSTSTLNCNVGGGSAVTATPVGTWCMNNNVFSGGTIYGDPYTSTISGTNGATTTATNSYPKPLGSGLNGMFSPIPGTSDSGAFSTAPTGGISPCPGATIANYETAWYDGPGVSSTTLSQSTVGIGFLHLGAAGTCYKFGPGIPTQVGIGCGVSGTTMLGEWMPALSGASAWTAGAVGLPDYHLCRSISQSANGYTCNSLQVDEATGTGTGNPNPSFVNGGTYWNGSSFVSEGSTVTAWSITSNVATFTAANSFTSGEVVWLTGFVTGSFFNAQQVTVLSTGLSGTHFEANFTHANATGSENACASLNGACDIGANIDLLNYELAGVQ